jgi:hypothetical protein
MTRTLRARQVTVYGLTSPWNMVIILCEIRTCFPINLCSCRSTRLPAWTNWNRARRNITWWLITELCCVPHLSTCSQPFRAVGRNLTSWSVYFFVFQIYPDPDSEKAIMGSVVYCIHHKEGCKWTGELRKLKVRNFSLINAYSEICLP